MAVDADHADQVWRALADPTRRAILDGLRDGPRTTGDLAEGLRPLSRFAVMKHLGVLRDAGLVVVRARGRERWHHLDAVPLREAYERWVRPLADRSAEGLLRLQDHVHDQHDRQHDDDESDEGATMTTTTRPTGASLTVETMEIEQEVVVDAPRDAVFDALLEMGSWWPHRFREEATARLEPVVGGRFWEEWPGVGGALYATVTVLQRPDVLAFSGSFGLDGPTTSVVRLQLEERDGATVVRCSHRAFGDLSDEERTGYASGWGEVLAVLRARVATAASAG